MHSVAADPGQAPKCNGSSLLRTHGAVRNVPSAVRTVVNNDTIDTIHYASAVKRASNPCCPGGPTVSIPKLTKRSCSARDACGSQLEDFHLLVPG